MPSKIAFKLNCSNQSKNTGVYYKIAIVSIAFLYSFALFYFIPMDDSIKDRLNYLVYSSNSEIIALRYLSSGVMPFLVNEPVWLIINITLNKFLTAENVVSSIIFFSAFVTAYLVLNSNPKHFVFLLFILIFPQVIGKYVIHLRQGFAISIFLLGWFTLSKPWRWLLFGLTPFIHASFFFVLVLLFYTSILKKLKFANDLRTVAVVSLGLFIGLGLGFIANILGARQAEEYEFSIANISGLGFLFWLIVFILFWMQGRLFTKENAFAMNVIVFYLTTYFLVEVTGRIFESTVIVVLLVSLGLTSWRRLFFLVLITFFLVLSWFIRLNQPFLGWGTGL
ncbi:EpsG family protein [Vibrio diabolicus]|uniref:EpsG family protein n=1 Tax=Vibrio diabolicus TaxID=50719 RepID=UPI00215ECADA|nr:EpsG family protein [Vibrio diabolicus]MCS0303638.1 EpsG family protein [Vibrio diabolicus]